ncbi:MAG: hypothetical protein ABJZ55_14050 [Fuerstiella sp.]
MTEKSDGSGPESSSNRSNPEQETTESEIVKQDASIAFDELPEQEELTPELIEEEAIRGDFMLRWAAIFLTILFGFGLIADTQALVHIRSGEFLASNGFLPNQQDGLSYAAPEEPLSNTSWLFDILMAQVYGIGGLSGLTIFKVAIAGLIAWLLSQVSVRMMPTWWSSICCVLAGAAFSIDLLPITDIMTLLGLTLTLLWLHKSTDGSISGLHWKLPLLIAIWANLDTRAYLGTFAVVLFALGTKLSGQQDKPVDSTNERSTTHRSKLGLAAALCFVALFVNPFPIASGLSAVTTYSVEYPNLSAMKIIKLNAPAIQDGRSEYFSLLSAEVWHGFEFAYLAGVCLLVIALIVLLLNRSRQDLCWAVTLLGFFLLTLIAVRELPAAALVAAVVAGTSAQRWYGRTFRQEYSIDTAEVMFSRGGRAATVFGMALLGFCIVADRLPTRTAIGFGLEPQLEATVTSLSDQMSEIPVDENLLNTKLSQGDLLVWDGRQSFVDSRVRLFGRRNAVSSVMNKFEALRQSLLPPPKPPEPKEGQEALEIPTNPFYDKEWKKSYDAYQIKQVMIRLSPPGPPAYTMVAQFNGAREWVPASRGPSAACYRYSSLGNELPDFSTADLAFKLDNAPAEKDVVSMSRFDFAQPPTFYQEYLYLERPTASAALRDAEHMMILDAASDNTAMQVAMQYSSNPYQKQAVANLGYLLAGPMVAIRRTNEALATNPNDRQAFRIQALAYQRLSTYEQLIAQVSNGQALPNLRYYQTLMAMHQSLIVAPDQPQMIFDLANVFQQRNRFDLALKYIQVFLELKGDELLNNPDNEKLIEELYAREAALVKTCEEADSWQTEMEAQDLPDSPQELAQRHFEIASSLSNQGFVLKSLEYMQQQDALLQPLSAARVLKGQLLLEAGELQEAFQLLNGVAEVASDPKYMQEYMGIRWQFPVALSHLGKAAYLEATDALKGQYAALGPANGTPPQIIQAILKTLPLVPAVESQFNAEISSWPMLQLNSSQIPMSALPTARTLPLLQMAVLNLEAGRTEEAQKQLKQLSESAGDSAYLPLAAAYLMQFGDEAAEELLATRLNTFSQFEFPEIPTEDGDGEKESSQQDGEENEDGDVAGKQSTDQETQAEDKAQSSKTDDAKPTADKPDKNKPDAAE